MRSQIEIVLILIVSLGACLGQELKVTVGNRSLTVTTNLSKQFYGRESKGTASVQVQTEPPDTSIVTVPSVPYVVSNYHLSAEIPYRAPSQGTTVHLVLGDIEDVHGSKAQLHGTVVLPSVGDTATGGASHISAKGTKPLTVETGASKPGANDKAGQAPPELTANPRPEPLSPAGQPGQTQPGQPSPPSQTRPKNEPEPPPPTGQPKESPWSSLFDLDDSRFYFVAAAGIAILASCSLLLVPWVLNKRAASKRRRELPQRSDDQAPIAGPSEGTIAPQSAYLTDVPPSSHAAEVSEQKELNLPAAGPPVDWEVDFKPATMADLRVVREEVLNLESAVNKERRVSQELNRYIGTARGLKELVETLHHYTRQLYSKPSEPAAGSSENTEGATAAAIVNRWLSAGSRNWQQLLGLARDVGVEAGLYGHRDLERVFQDIATYEYCFEPSEDGPWLWVRQNGTNEFWAVPADAVFFQAGSAPALLARLFDGMQAGNADFRFKMIYKPCRLCPVSGKSNIYRLTEKGVLLLQGSREPNLPMPISYSELLLWRRQTSQNDSIGSALSLWISEVSERLVGLHQAVERSAATGREHRETIDKRLQTLSAAVEASERRISEQLNPLEERNVELKAMLERLSQSLENELVARHSDAARIKPKPSEKTKREAIESSSQEVLRNQPDFDWKMALDRAAARPGSRPAEKEVPSENVYITRVASVAAELKRLDPATDARVVHLRKRPAEEMFEIHATREDEHQMWCLQCDAPQTWQLAIRAGANGDDVSILLPKGHFARGNYAAGYNALLESPSSSAFLIEGIESPALLHYEADTRAYSVKRKMVLSRSPGTEEAGT